MEELDDWGLSAEELNFLEEDAIRKISERKASSLASSSSSSPLARQADASKNPPFKPVDKPPSKTSLESRYGKVTSQGVVLVFM